MRRSRFEIAQKSVTGLRMPSARASGRRSTKTKRAANMNHRTSEVAMAAPSAPSSGPPRLPKMRIQLSSTLTTTAASMTSMPGIGRLMPSRKWVHTTHMKSAGEPHAIISSTRPPPAATSGSCPVASRV